MQPDACFPELEGAGKTEMCYFYLVLFNMGLLYMKFIKDVISSSKLASLSRIFR